MQFNEVVNIISALGICPKKCIVSRNQEIRNIFFLKDAPSEFCTDTLYIGRADMFPAFRAKKLHINLIFCGTEELPTYVVTENTLNCLVIENKDTAQLIYNRIRLRLFPRPMEEYENMQKLLNALLSGNGLQNMSDVATKVFENPMRISDLSFNYLVKLDLESSSDPFLQEFIEGHTNARHVTYNRDNLLRERQRDLRYTILSPLPPTKEKHQVLGSALLSCPILISGVIVGYGTLYDAYRPFKLEDYELLDYFCKLVSLEMQKSSYYIQNKGMRYSCFLHDLLTQHLSNIKDVRERLHTIGWTPKKYLYMLDVKIENTTANLDIVTERLHQATGHSIYTIIDGEIAVLMSSDKEIQIKNSTLQNFLSDVNLRAALSNSFTNILEARKHFESAQSVLKIGERLAPQEYLYYVPNYTAYQLFEKHDCEILLQQLANGAIPKLRAHDETLKPLLVDTLRCWLEHNLSISGAADELGIHKNTMLYRMDLIRDITALNLSGRDELLQLLMALKLLDYEAAEHK